MNSSGARLKKLVYSQKGYSNSGVFLNLHKLTKPLVLNSLFFLFLTLPALAYSASRENYYQASGKPWFLGFDLGDFRINLPGFLQPIPLEITRSPRLLTLTFISLLFLFCLITSHLLLCEIGKVAFGIKTSFFFSLIFHSLPVVQAQILSASVYDFFPKVHLTELSILYFLRRSYLTARQHVTFLCFLAVANILAISMRFSSLSISLATLTLLIILYKKRLANVLYAPFFFFGFCIFIFGFNVYLQSQNWSLKFYSITSLYLANQPLQGQLVSIPRFPNIFKDVLIGELAANPELSLFSIFREKSVFYPFHATVLNLITFLEQNSPLSLISNLLRLDSPALQIIIFVIALLIISFCPKQGIRVMVKTALSFFVASLFLAFFSRLAYNQESHLLIFVVFSQIYLLTRIATSIKSKSLQMSSLNGEDIVGPIVFTTLLVASLVISMRITNQITTQTQINADNVLDYSREIIPEFSWDDGLGGGEFLNLKFPKQAANKGTLIIGINPELIVRFPSSVSSPRFFSLSLEGRQVFIPIEYSPHSPHESPKLFLQTNLLSLKRGMLQVHTQYGLSRYLQFRYSQFETGLSSFQSPFKMEDVNSNRSISSISKVRTLKVKFPFVKSSCPHSLEILCGQGSYLHPLDLKLLGKLNNRFFCLRSERHALLTISEGNIPNSIMFLSIVDRGQLLCFEDKNVTLTSLPLVYIWYNPLLDFSTQIQIFEAR